MYGADNLLEECAGVRFFEPPPRPHVRMEISRAGREDEIGTGCAHNHLTDGIDVGMAIHPVMGRQKALPTWVVQNGLQKNKMINNINSNIFSGILFRQNAPMRK